jgi:hypothetical protein
MAGVGMTWNKTFLTPFYSLGAEKGKREERGQINEALRLEFPPKIF